MRHFANVLSPERRRLELGQAADKVLLTAATSTLLRQGAILWVGGRETRWDARDSAGTCLRKLWYAARDLRTQGTAKLIALIGRS
jgi:hypothetical protein